MAHPPVLSSLQRVRHGPNGARFADDRINTSITVPGYVSDIAKVEIWCAFVEVVLGEASFAKPIALRAAKYATK